MSINAVIDLSHHNGNVDLGQVQADGVIGVIHKSTQGLRDVDPLYAANREKARSAGLLWGAYHFGVGNDGAEQADYFLANALPDATTLLALDFEPNPDGQSMTLDQARDFVVRVKAKTGRTPGFYSGNRIKELLGAQHDPVLAQCWFWLAQYGPTATVPANWPTWTLWQYTDGTLGKGPHTVKGVGRCDRSRFNGDEPHLRQLWGAI